MKYKFAFSQDNLVLLVALLTAGMGVVNVISAVMPSFQERTRLLQQYSPFIIRSGGHLTSALSGFALLLLSVSLWRRKQLGWALTLITLLLSIPVHLLKGLDYEEATLAALLAGLLIYLRPHFHARSDPPSVKQGIQTLLAALAFSLVYGVIGFYVLDRHFQVNFGFWAAVRQTIVMFTAFYDPGLQPVTGFGRYFADSIYAVGAVTISYALFMLLRPVLAHRGTSADDLERAWTIVRAHGQTSIARYTLFDDKLFFYSPAGSVISYVVENRVALALGDPIGPPGEISSAVSAFRQFCSSNDWLPAFYQVLPDYLHCYQELGFEQIAIGREAIVDLKKFTLEGSENKTLRNSYNKMTRLGFQAGVLQPPYSPRMLRELNSISNEWLTSRGVSEMRYSLGWFDEAYLGTCPVMLVRDREGFMEAFANIVTEFQADEVAVDMMRYRRVSESGLMDFLFVSLLQWAAQQNFARFNLGLSALSGVGEQTDDPIRERALHYIYQNINRFYNFHGLHAFKEKFHPTWSPRYLVYSGAQNLLAIGVALMRAHLGRGLLSLLRRN